MITSILAAKMLSYIILVTGLIGVIAFYSIYKRNI